MEGFLKQTDARMQHEEKETIELYPNLSRNVIKNEVKIELGDEHKEGYNK